MDFDPISYIMGQKSGGSGGNSSGDILIVSVSYDTMALNKTWQEIADAGFAIITIEDFADAGQKIYMNIAAILMPGPDSLAGNKYCIVASSPLETESELYAFIAESQNDYPVFGGPL